MNATGRELHRYSHQLRNLLAGLAVDQDLHLFFWTQLPFDAALPQRFGRVIQCFQQAESILHAEKAGLLELVVGLQVVFQARHVKLGVFQGLLGNLQRHLCLALFSACVVGKPSHPDDQRGR